MACAHCALRCFVVVKDFDLQNDLFLFYKADDLADYCWIKMMTMTSMEGGMEGDARNEEA